MKEVGVSIYIYIYMQYKCREMGLYGIIREKQWLQDSKGRQEMIITQTAAIKQ